ncbi:hypothetical protein EAKF1_ch0032c [Escherichia albertii KF1]|nr:hypothetical protein EAKF1_ch0032c [Escherichia albertii KF1]
MGSDALSDAALMPYPTYGGDTVVGLISRIRHRSLIFG